MKPMVYISGPITGIPDLNRKEFDDAADALCLAGYIPINPHEIGTWVRGYNKNASWRDYMIADIPRLITSSAFILLEGWQDSRGARLEEHIARELGIPELREIDTEWEKKARSFGFTSFGEMEKRT